MKEKDIDKYFEELIEESQDTDKYIEKLGEDGYTDKCIEDFEEGRYTDEDYNEEPLMELYEKQTGKNAITSRKTLSEDYLKWKEQ